MQIHLEPLKKNLETYKIIQNPPGTMKNHENPTWNHEKGGGAGKTEKRHVRGVTTDLLDV